MCQLSECLAAAAGWEPGVLPVAGLDSSSSPAEPAGTALKGSQSCWLQDGAAEAATLHQLPSTGPGCSTAVGSVVPGAHELPGAALWEHPHRPAMPPSTKPGRCPMSRWLLPSRGGEVAGMSLCCSTSNVLMKRLPNTNPATNELLDHPLTETVMNWRRRRSEDVRFPPLFTELDASRGIASSLLGTTTALTAE